ncbi:MAG TPA: TetR/AcrR family transcriptional regulator [Trueperaceae bacterium]|nr:TetR/AcrR family transcriptional regulator [Trueperaceae bacterium]
MGDDDTTREPRAREAEDPPTAGGVGGTLDPRRRILRATAELIAELGWAHVTTRKVAERAGVNNALVHYYFGTKRALLLQAATDAFMNELGGPLEAIFARDDLGEAVAEAIAWLGRAGPSHTTGRIVVEMMLQAVHDPALREISRQMLLDFRHAVQAKAAEQGWPAETAAGLATVLAALLDGLYLHVLVDPELDLRAAAAVLSPLFSKEDG